MTAPDGAGTSKAKPLDAERERLRALGHTDEEIREILVKRELQQQSHSPARAATGAGGSGGQGMYSQVLGSCLAVFGYVKDSLAAIPDHFTTLRDGHATPAAKREAGAALTVKLALTGLLIFGAGMEFVKLFIYETATAKNQVDITREQAREQAGKAAAVSFSGDIATGRVTNDGFGNNPAAEEDKRKANLTEADLPSAPSCQPGKGATIGANDRCSNEWVGYYRALEKTGVDVPNDVRVGVTAKIEAGRIKLVPPAW